MSDGLPLLRLKQCFVLLSGACLFFAWATAAQPEDPAVDSPAAPPSLQMPPLPLRPLPQPSSRPMADGASSFIDAAKGDDNNAGTREAPWKTLTHAVPRLQAGSTLYLRGGVYYERPVWSPAATADQPITIRSFPGELAIIDGGYREFAETPATCWQPNSDGVKGEYVSTRTYPELSTEAGRRGVQVLARTVEGMLPLHGYKYLSDLRSTNEYWNTTGTGLDDSWNIYVGPGVWLNPETNRIHIRLAPLTIEQYGNRRIPLEQDPRRLPLVISGPGNTLSLDKAAHLKLQDVVLRGAQVVTMNIRGSRGVTLDGVTVYAGVQALNVTATKDLRLLNSVFRGQSAPWSTRASQKYRGNSPYLLACGAGNSEFEFAHCEFTDSHDGLVIGTVTDMKFHHNIVENMNDDGIYVSRGYGGGPIHIYQNRISQTLSGFAFAVTPANAIGRGVYIYRNFLDMRRPTLGGPPAKPEDKTLFLRPSRPVGDHGSPVWEPMWVYHNTILVNDAGWRGYYAAGLGMSFRGTKRRVWNNIVVQETQLPGLTFDTYGKVAKVQDDFEANHNLLWSLRDGPQYKGDLFAPYRAGAEYSQSVELHPPGWTTGDIFADPLLTDLKTTEPGKVDFRLHPNSPAVDAGLVLPAEYFDPLRDIDAGKPDIGALPLGAPLPQVGPQRP